MSFIPALKDKPFLTIPIDSVVLGGIMGGIGFLVSKITNVSPLFALVIGIEIAVLSLITGITSLIAKKSGLEAYKIGLINVAIYAAVTTAGIVALVALGIFTGPLTIGLASGLTAGMVLFKLGGVAYLYYLHHNPGAAKQAQAQQA